MSLLRMYTTILIIGVVTLPLLYAGNLQGIVSDKEDGSPIAGAQVFALTYTPQGDSLFYSANSGEDGHYIIDNMEPYSYMVWCQHADYMPKKINDVVVSQNADFILDFVLDRSTLDAYNTLLSGTVYGSQGLLTVLIPIEGATITLSNYTSYFQTQSDAQGRYRFENIPPGEYNLSAQAPHHEPYESSDIIMVAEGDYIEDYDIYLVPIPFPNPSTVYGTITDAEDNTPVYPAYVTLIPLYYSLNEGILPADPEVYAVINNPDGSYIIENLPSGDYLVVCSAQTYIWQRIEAIRLEEQAVKADFFLEAIDPEISNLISGTIYEYPTKGRVLPLVDVKLTYISPPIESIYYSLSDGFGHYQFHDLMSGVVSLRLLKPGYQPLMDSLQVEDNTWLINHNFSMEPINTIDPIILEGHVYDSTSSQIVYPAQIQLYTVNSTGEQIRYDTVNNPDGSYMIDGIKPGTYTVVCSAMGYESELIKNLNLSEHEVTLDFYLSPLNSSHFGTIKGRVYFDRLNEPVAGALINFLPKYTDLLEYDAAYYTVTDDDGSYHIRLPADEYIVSCQYRDPDGWYYYQEYYDDAHQFSDAKPVNLHTGETISGINFGIPYPAIVSSIVIKGNVSDNEGNALAQALVSVRPYDLTIQYYTEANNIYEAQTDDQGNYTIEINLYWLTIPTPVLGFIVSASKDGYITEFYKEQKTPYEADILWAFSDTTFSEIDFTLDPFNQINAIQGTITTESGAAIAQAFIIGINAISGDVSFTMSNTSGDYSLSGLERSYYFLMFIAGGYLPEFYDDALIWEEAKPIWVDGLVSEIDAELTPMLVFEDSVKGIVTGRISDKEGNPISGAMVTMQLKDNAINAFSLSDSDGMFEMPWTTAGNYLITISRVGYSSYSAWITVNQETRTTSSLIFTLYHTITGLPNNPGNGEEQSPERFMLHNNYPNPFNPLTHIEFDLPIRQQVSLTIYDILGHLVRELLSDNLPAGTHTVTWDATNQKGNKVSSGIYFYVLQTPNKRLIGKMILQK